MCQYTFFLSTLSCENIFQVEDHPSSVSSVLQRQVRSGWPLLHDAWADGEHRHKTRRLWWRANLIMTSKFVNGDPHQASCLFPRKIRSLVERNTISSSSHPSAFLGAKHINVDNLSRFLMHLSHKISGMVTLSGTLEIWWMSLKFSIGSLIGRLLRFQVR